MPRKAPLGSDPLGGVDAGALDDLLPRRRPAAAAESANLDGEDSGLPRRRRLQHRPPGPAASPAGSRTGSPVPTTEPESPNEAAPAKPARAQLTVDLPADLLAGLRAVAYWTPGLTLTALAAEGLARELARREEERGEPFPPAGGPLAPGPPVGRTRQPDLPSSPASC